MMIRAMVKEPNKDAEELMVVNEYVMYNKLVGGYIQVVRLPTDRTICIICNEEGKIKGLQPNFMLREYRDIIVGTAVFVGDDGGGAFISLTKKQIENIKKYLQ